MHPELAVVVGRDRKTLDCDAGNAGIGGFDENRVAAGGHPQHLETQRRHGHALRLHDNRHPSHDAVALDPDRQQTATAGGGFEHRRTAQQARKFQHEALRILAKHRKPGDGQLLVELGHDIRQSGFAEHHGRLAQRLRQDVVIARQRAQFGAGLLVEVAKGLGGGRRIKPVGLCEHDVKSDCSRPKPGQVGNEVGDHRPRPWPLAEFCQTPFVDVDDPHRPCGLHAGVDDLEGIEGPDPEFLDRRGIGDAQHGKSDQQSDAEQPRIAELSLEPPS